MPKPKVEKRKIKKESSNDDSSSSESSGPDDMIPEPKRPKSEPSKSPSSSSKSKDKKSDNDSWQLDKTRFIKISEFRGKFSIDIREYYEKNGELLPGKKGISLNGSQWEKFKEVMSEVDEAYKKANK